MRQTGEAVDLAYASRGVTSGPPPHRLDRAAVLMLVGCMPALTLLETCLRPGCYLDRAAITRALVGSGLYGSLEMYRMHVGDYPSNLADLLARPADPRQAALWRGRYLRDDSRLDDGWGRALIYVYPGVRNAGTFDLFSVGADGVAGTADDIE